MQYRVVFFLTLWIALWMTVGTGVGSLFTTPVTGMIAGFVFALFSTFLWPWIVPDHLDDWMDGQTV